MTTPSEGHNSELTADERRALSMHHFRAIQAQKAKVDEQSTEYKRLRKLAKADGLVLSDIDFMLRCADVEDDTIIPDRLKREMEIASWFALPVSFQADLFGVDQREPGIDKAKREGEAAGYAGKNPEPPYSSGSEQGQSWMRGWHDAQAAMRADLESAMEKRNAAKAEAAEPDFPEDDDDETETDAGSADRDWAAADPANQVPAE